MSIALMHPNPAMHVMTRPVGRPVTRSVSKQVCALSVLSLALLASFPTWAQTPPDAGQTQRDLQRQPLVPPPESRDPLRIQKGSTTPLPAADGSRIAVRAITVSGNSAFSSSQLQRLVGDLVGGEHTLTELDQAAARITDWYRRHGYAVARAYIPAQEIRDGVLQIKVLEGHIGQQHLQNSSRVPDATLAAYLAAEPAGALVQVAPINRGLLLLNDLPGIGSARASLQPGASVGSSDLMVQVDPSAPYNGSVALDNYGNRYTGEYRLGGNFAWNNPLLQRGDVLNARVLTSGPGLSYARLAYQVPVGGDGWRLGAAYSALHYRLGRDFEALDGHGTADNASLYATYPLLRSQASNLGLVAMYEHKDLRDRFGAVPEQDSNKALDVLTIGLSGSRYDALFGGGVSTLDLTLAQGRVHTEIPSSVVTPAISNDFTRFGYSVSRLQNLGPIAALSATLSGQWANRNLNSSEQFVLGGANGVRAYPQGEGAGDEGWLLNLELRRTLWAGVQGSLFYDAGTVKISHNPVVDQNNTRHLAGAGVGLNAVLGAVQLKASLAWRTQGGVPNSEPASASHDPRFWLQAALPF
ncbi:MAG: ShlB/FhaC/HecB family hemolysin secretion/activation protein [Herbaspirillum sp.]